MRREERAFWRVGRSGGVLLACNVLVKFERRDLMKIDRNPVRFFLRAHDLRPKIWKDDE